MEASPPVQVKRGFEPYVEVCRQPSPQRNSGGDCYACSLIALLRALFPEREPLTFEQCDEWFSGKWAGEAGKEQERGERPPPTDNTWNGFQKALDRARFEGGYDIEWTTDMVVPEWDHRKWGFGWAWQNVNTPYCRRMEGYLKAGWIAATVINFDGAGPISPEFTFNSTDHFLLIDGVRNEGRYWNDPELHLVCSARGPYWIGSREFLTRYGGNPFILVRRVEEDD